MQKLRQRCLYSAFSLGIRGLRLLSWPATAQVLRWGMDLVGRCLPLNRMILANLERIFPNQTAYERRLQAQRIRRNWGLFAALSLHFPHLLRHWGHTPRCLPAFPFPVYDAKAPYPKLTVEGETHIDALETENHPTIFFTAHKSFFPAILAALAKRGWAVVPTYRKFPNARIDAYFRRFFDCVVPEVLTLEEIRGWIRALEEGKALFVLPDHSSKHGVEIPFLGHDALTSRVLPKLQMRFPTLRLVPVVVHQTHSGDLRVRFEAALPLLSDPHGEGTHTLLTRMNQCMSEWIFHDPDDWNWLYDRWSSQDRSHAEVKKPHKLW